MRLRALWWTVGVVLAITVFVLGVLPGKVLPTKGFNDKVNHALAYLALTLWFAGLVRHSRWAWLAAGLMTLGVLVEIVQTLTPFGRLGDVKDLLANAVGMTAGFLLAYVGLWRWPVWLDALCGRRTGA